MEIENQNHWCVYIHTNKINNKAYIGITSKPPEKRWKNGNGYKGNKIFNRAINKYGWENFEHNIFMDGLSEDKAKHLEMLLIALFKTNCKRYNDPEYGYNLTDGGQGRKEINIEEIYSLWDKGMTITEIAKATAHDRHSISNILQKYTNYSKEESTKRQYEFIARNNKTPICQYDLNGNFIQRFDSIAEAEKQTNINYHTICSNLSHQSMSAGGFQWELEGENPPKKYNAKRSGDKKAVIQLTLQNEFVKEYESISAALQAVGLSDHSSITICCNNPNRTAAGYHWMWKKDYNKADVEAH